MAHLCPDCKVNMCDGADDFVCMECFERMWQEMNMIVSEGSDE